MSSFPPPPLSVCMAVIEIGTLVYIGDKGKLHEIIGGNNGEINLRALE